MDNRIVFHFNKKHNEDPTVPPWVVKHKGQTHYVHNLICTVPFTTKNTPDNPMTKGSLLLRGELGIVEDGDELIALVHSETKKSDSN